MARIVINHLASIQHIEVDIKQMNVFIGEQATGKSTLCKAIYYFRNFKEMLLDYYYSICQNGSDEEEMRKVLTSRLKQSFVGLFGYSWQLPMDLSMEYFYGEQYSIRVYLRKNRKQYISVQYSRELLNRLENFYERAKMFYDKNIAGKDMDMLQYFEIRKFYETIEQEISVLLDDEMTTYYIPAGRGLLSLLCNQKTYLNYQELDPINRRFMRNIETLQPRFVNGTSEVYKFYPMEERKFDVRKVSDEIIRGLKGEYFYQRGQEYLQIEENNERVLINFASSGQQECLWVYNQLYALMLKDEKAFVIIEEPEAHLYPILQKDITDFIIKYINITGGSAIVTTHSPYILTEINNMYISGQLRKDDKAQKKMDAAIGKWMYITPKELNAYKLSNGSDGTEIVSLIDEEAGELQADKIDTISEEINAVYTKLFYLGEEMQDEEN